ncbi:MAG: hypothetical protein AB1894_26025 [Chloroflexota bacterium]
MSLHNTLPTIVVSNFAEAHVDFLGRAADPNEREDLINGESYHGDRTLLWAGDPKLVFVSYPVAHAEWITSRLNYPGTRHLAPSQPTPYLSLDILREPALLQALVDYAGAERRVQILPYATTPEFLRLVKVLREEHQLTVLLPESPLPENLWVRDYVDTKSGFHLLASRWLADAGSRLPLGIVCNTPQKAARAARWFCERGETCVIKADTGESGIGFNIFSSCNTDLDESIEILRQNSYLNAEPILVEQFISAKQQLSPSPEVFVPPLGQGEPYIMYPTQQLFMKFGDFCGILVSGEQFTQPWYADLKRSSLAIARGLQEMGYVGHFDLDCVVDDEGQLYLLEVNARRTGGTHVHDFAMHCIGEDYLDKVALISHEANDSGRITQAGELMEVLSDLLYPMNGEPRGVVVTITTPLFKHHFGAIFVAPSVAEAQALQAQVQERIRQA